MDSAAADGGPRDRKLSDAALEEAVDVMCTLNRAPVEAMDGFDIHAVDRRDRASACSATRTR